MVDLCRVVGNKEVEEREDLNDNVEMSLKESSYSDESIKETLDYIVEDDVFNQSSHYYDDTET